MRHAYLILAHSNFYCLERLVCLLDDPRNDIYIHVDKKTEGFPFEKLSRLVCKSGLYYTRRTKVRWGSYSMIAAELILFGEASKKQYSYYHLLSGADLPLKPQTEIHDFFDRHQGTQFISCAVEMVVEEINAVARFAYYYFPFDKNGRLVRLQKKAGFVRQTGGVTCGFGSQWVSLTHEAVTWILTQKNRIRKTFRLSFACDEVYKQTLLQGSAFKDALFPEKHNPARRISHNMREIVWTGGAHPQTFTKADYDYLSKSENLFARKFDDSVDREIIDLIFKDIYAKQANEARL